MHYTLGTSTHCETVKACSLSPRLCVEFVFSQELIDFDLFCVISVYLSVLQQEIHESGCISPIKGTNVPPPQVNFTNAPDVDIYYPASKNISRTSSNASVSSNSSSGIGHDLERQSIVEQLSRSRHDSAWVCHSFSRLMSDTADAFSNLLSLSHRNCSAK